MEFEFRVRDDFAWGTVGIYMFAPGPSPGVVHLVRPADLVVSTETVQVVPEPAFSLTPGEARRLYEALGQYLGVIDAAHAAAVIKAKDEHLRDLRELVMRQPVATSPVLAESVQAEPRHGSSVSLYFEDAEIGQQVADWITNVTRKASPE
jgi:hypothetical protein